MLAAATQRMADLVPVLIKTIGEQAAQLRNVEALQTQVKALDTKQADALRILEAMAAFTTSAAAAQNAKQQQQKQDQEEQPGSQQDGSDENEDDLPAEDLPINSSIRPLPDGMEYHYFMSHVSISPPPVGYAPCSSVPCEKLAGQYQATGADQVGMIELELRQLGFRSWVDNKAEDLTKEGMRSGIESSGVFLCFLSKGVLKRPVRIQALLLCAEGFLIPCLCVPELIN